jgi:hypothetical protein
MLRDGSEILRAQSLATYEDSGTALQAIRLKWARTGQGLTKPFRGVGPKNPRINVTERPTSKLYDRTSDEITLNEIERIGRAREAGIHGCRALTRAQAYKA